MAQAYFNSIQDNINNNILRAKITKALCEFAIESIEPIKDKATTQRVIPAIERDGKVLYKAWQKDFEIDGYKGYFSVTLRTEKERWEEKSRKFLSIYSHAYNEAKNAYAPEPRLTEVWKCGADEQTWETFLEELQKMVESYKLLPTPEQVEKYLNECEELKKATEEFEEKHKAFGVYGGEYMSESPARWRVRG